MIDKRNTTSAPKPHSAAMQPVHAPITRNFAGVGEVKGKKMILCMWRFKFLFKNSFPTRYKYAGDILMHVCFFNTWKGRGKPKKSEVVKFDRLFFEVFQSLFSDSILSDTPMRALWSIRKNSESCKAYSDELASLALGIPNSPYRIFMCRLCVCLCLCARRFWFERHHSQFAAYNLPHLSSLKSNSRN